ncbi:MAG: polysaccharide pyruvyl transferase family protein [Thermofilaceae archaeon]
MKYGLLVARTENIGDYIQTIAAKQFLPRVDVYLDRDNLKDVKYVNDKIKVIMNGWFTDRPEKWPPSRVIEPLFISFHVSPHIAWRFLRKEVIEYLKQYEPIGCRDIWTMRLLNHFGIKAYFSGCLTLTLDYKYGAPKREEKIIIIDLDPRLKKYIVFHENIKIKELSHSIIKPVSTQIMRVMSSRVRHIHDEVKGNPFVRLAGNLLTETLFKTIDLKRTKEMPLEMIKVAEAIVREIASAKLVITSRLHAALPSLAFKTPVIFVPSNPLDPRFSGYLEYLTICPPHSFKRCIAEININNPPLPPNLDKLQVLKQNLIATVKNFLAERGGKVFDRQ